MSHVALRKLRPADRRRILVAGGVAVLAIVTVILSVIALTQFSGNPSANASQATSPSETPTTTQAPDPTATSTPSSVVLVPPTRLLAAFDGRRVYRATVAACPDPRTTFEVSSDGGVTWEGSDVAESTDSTAALNLTAGSSDVVHMVTLTAECAPQYLRSFVGGIEWQVFNSDLPVTWYFDPADGTTVNTPQGARSTPCTAVSMAATGSRAAVLCTDSTIFVTEDSAASWSSAISVRNAAAIGVSPRGYRIAVLDAEGCTGIQLGELVDGEFSDLGACLGVEAVQGDVAVTTAADGSTFVWAGDVFSGSPNGGATW